MSAVEISDAAAHEATPSETAPTTGAAAPAPPDDGTQLSNERPFPGLRPFGFADRAFFFGRERQAFALYRLVENGRFIAVIGGSGSGKSSLVLAGLQALLADETADSGGPTWAFLDMRPGGAPITRLASALSRLSAKDSPDETARRRDRVEWTLRRSSFSFESALAEAGGLGDRSLILVVDQFEELFRFGLAGLGYRRGGVEEARRRDEATQFVQILLDADRRRIQNVRVLITMRSDFIGDCAYFHGLSEAVSATQYLVPNLTRSQLEDAIRKPIEKAGGTIEPELVERLLNDCGDELDQLPVLQHCLMRLWDRAGAETPAGGARHLTRLTYDAIGRMADALSRHADEIFAQCAGEELAIEQAFRALSEIDREGRAIRRALRFDKLLAETGVSESDLRAGLDRFRAPNCSFLLPSLSVASALAADDRIDIGHETLLRRWKKLAGETKVAEAKTGRPVVGWLAEEQLDGQRYRTLVSLLDGVVGGEKASLTDPQRTKRWWDSLPRTAAWAERHGGRFSEVRKLIADNITAKRHRTAGWAAAVLCGVAAVALFAWQSFESSVEQQKASSLGAMTAAKDLLDQFLDSYIKGNITESGSRSLAEMVANFVAKVRGAADTPDAEKLWIQSLNIEADLATNFAEPDNALTLSRQAKEAAEQLASRFPKDPGALQARFDSEQRVGDALLSPPYKLGAVDAAFEAFNDALAAANEMAVMDPGEKPIDDAIKIHLKIGDTYRRREPPAQDDALREYLSSLAISEALVAKYPNDKDALRDRGAANYRIGLVFADTGRWDEAYTAFTNARLDQETLVHRVQDDETLKSNLSATHIKLGDMWVTKNALPEALADYQQGVSLQEGIIAKDPLAPRYRDWLAPDYKKLAYVLDRLNMTTEARHVRRDAYINQKELAQIDPGNDFWQSRWARAAKQFGDQFKGEYRLEIYREALNAWKLVAVRLMAQNLTLGAYDDHIQMAEAFAAAKDWGDAADAYSAAANIARLNLAAGRQTDYWQDKLGYAAQASEAATESSGRLIQVLP
jgi:energy-coupling factor transporter ATP-binding protein EcfA2